MLSLLLEQIWLVLEDKCILPSVSSPSQNRRKELVLVITSQVSYWLWPIREQILFLVTETKKYFFLILFNDPYLKQWNIIQLSTLWCDKESREWLISLFIPSQGEEVVVMEIYWPLKLSMVKVIKVRRRGNIQYYWNNWNIMEYRKMKKQTVRKN